MAPAYNADLLLAYTLHVPSQEILTAEVAEGTEYFENVVTFPLCVLCGDFFFIRAQTVRWCSPGAFPQMSFVNC